MKLDVKLVVDKFVDSLLGVVGVNENQDEIRAPICQVLRRLNLATLQIITDKKVPETQAFHYTATKKLKAFFGVDDDDNDENDNDENNDNDNNNDNNNDNDNNDDDEEDLKRARKRNRARR